MPYCSSPQLRQKEPLKDLDLVSLGTEGQKHVRRLEIFPASVRAAAYDEVALHCLRQCALTSRKSQAHLSAQRGDRSQGTSSSALAWEGFARVCPKFEGLVQHSRCAANMPKPETRRVLRSQPSSTTPECQAIWDQGIEGFPEPFQKAKHRLSAFIVNIRHKRFASSLLHTSRPGRGCACTGGSVFIGLPCSMHSWRSGLPKPKLNHKPLINP